MKKILSILLLMLIFNTTSFAVEFDASIDESIRKEYKLKESEETLPSLPNVVPTATTITPLKTDVKATGKTYTIKGGTKVTLASQRNITDKLARGTKISFVSQNNITTKEGITIPAGTLLKAVVTDSHSPQLTGNGGLVELYFNEIYFNGVMSPLNSKVNNANYKKIFFNDIKGERKYWKNFSKATKPGQKVFNATKSASSTMSMIPVVNIISFIPIVGGTAFYAINAVVAPVIAVFTKGGNLSLPSGTNFEIKIKGDTEIRG